ncbi:MAG: DUF3857 domain-containing protein [Myxococcota bacterium]
MMRRTLGVVWAAVLALALGDRAQAAPTGEAPLTHVAERARAGGPAAYAALRHVWQAWEGADARRVEAALAGVQQDPAVAPAVRVYAGLLGAYAKRRRGDLRGAQRSIAALGYVRDWLVIGPFDNDNRTGLDTVELVERELSEPIDTTRTYGGKERAVRWRLSPDVHPYGVLDLGALTRPQRDQCTYAATFVESPEAGTATLWVGATGAVVTWFNGTEVLRDEGYRQLDADRRGVVVAMEKGMNRVTVEVCGDESPPALSLRVGAADGGVVASGVRVVASLEASRAYAARVRTEDTADRARRRRVGRRRAAPVLGPLDAIDAALEAGVERVGPERLFAFADYLAVTGGDADATHLARDLAGRSARAAPTLRRCLLAASLAEDRNGARAFLDQAEALATTPSDRVAWLLARARWLRAGPNPREAFSLYADVIAIDPMRVEARLGQVDLYVEAGLPRTALSTLREAVARQPQSVALLRHLAGRLRALGRDTEAAEVEARYAAFRFDDRVYLKRRLELAVARRDGAAVARAAARLLQAEPASVWAHAAVAEAHVGLGARDKARAQYERALAIAPDDVETLGRLAELHGLMGARDEQVALLRRILRIVPQAKGTRAHLEHIAPSGKREDEGYAWPPEQFLSRRTVTDDEEDRRVLRDLTVTKVFDNGLATKFRQVVFQPLTDEQAARSRQYAFAYHADRQVVTLRAAKVYRRDGRVDEAVESGEAPANDPSVNMYTLMRTFFVQFPRLEVGDVVELQYRVEDVAVRNEMSDYFGEVTFLQSADPIASAEYVLIAPRARRLQLSVGPGDPPLAGLRREVTEEGNRRIYRFEARDVPALAVEPRMPRWGELLAHVHVSTFRDWTEVGRWYAGLAGPKLDADDDVRATARRLVAGASTPREKVNAIYRHAAGAIRYVALEFGIEGIRPRRAALTLSRGWGDCKDKATLIVSMLREVGIEAELVLVRTQQRGKFDPTVASLAPFDHAIAYIPSLDLYLDGTAEDTASDALPAMDRGAMALRITKKGGVLVTLPDAPAEDSTDRRRYDVELRANGGLRFRFEAENQGVDAAGWRRRYRDPATQRERAGADLAGAFGPVAFRPGSAGLQVFGSDDIEAPVRLVAAGSADAKRQGTGWRLPAGPGTRLVARFASQPSRAQDVVVGARRSRDETWRITLPPGLSPVGLPKPTKVATPFGSFSVDVTRVAPRVVEVRTRLVLATSRITPSQYGAWRAFCQQVDAASGAVVVAQ